MSERVIRGGGGKHVPVTARHCWTMAFDAMASASDDVEEPQTRKACAAAGVGWARVAYLMERAAALGIETPEERE